MIQLIDPQNQVLDVLEWRIKYELATQIRFQIVNASIDGKLVNKESQKTLVSTHGQKALEN